jgi:hypothetical protein
MTYYDLAIMSGNRTTDFRQRDMHAAHDAFASYFYFKLANNEHLLNYALPSVVKL